jgi:hypothetical protein
MLRDNGKACFLELSLGFRGDVLRPAPFAAKYVKLVKGECL